MAIAHGTDHEKTIRAALGALGGMERFIQKGDVVMLKPNVAFDRPPALAATTHPDALRAVAKLVLRSGREPGHRRRQPDQFPHRLFPQERHHRRRVGNESGLDLSRSQIPSRRSNSTAKS